MTLKKSDFNNSFMLEALKEAEKAYLEGEVPVGCIIVHKYSKEIIAKSHNLVEQNNNPNLHAEMIAINAACELIKSKNLSDYNIYVTLEPCNMCASAIANARFSSLYYAASDIKQGAVENGTQFFKSKSCFHKPEIYTGIESFQSESLIKKFFKKLRNNNF